MAAEYDSLTVTIADAASLSDAGALNGRVLCGIQLPSGWSTQHVTFQGSVDGSNFFDVYDATNTEVTISSAAASRFYQLEPAKFAGLKFVKVRSGTSAAPVTQSGIDIITLVARDL